MSDKIRIQKHLSQAGILSRRKTEEYIQNGWIKVNGQLASIGMMIDPEQDHIELDQEIKKIQQQYCYLLFHKPRLIDTHSPQHGHQEIKDLLPKKYQRLNPIGRLDYESEGLILLSDDGRFSTYWLNSDHAHERAYLVWVHPPLNPTQQNKIEEGVTLFNENTQPIQVEVIQEGLYKLTLSEGKNRQIRRIIQKVGAHVTRLKRVSFGPFQLRELKPGDYREIPQHIIDAMLKPASPKKRVHKPKKSRYNKSL